MSQFDILPPNSNKSRAENETEYAKPSPPKPYGKPIARLSGKKNGRTGRKLIRMFLAEDVDNVGEYLVRDLIIPGMKDVFFNFLWAVFWGDRKVGTSRGDGRTPYYKASQTARVRSGSGISSLAKRAPEREEAPQTRRFDLDDLVFDTKAEADGIRDSLIEYINEYGQAPVAYLASLIEGAPSEWTNEYYGWTNPDEIRLPRRVGRGWALDLPRPVMFKK